MRLVTYHKFESLKSTLLFRWGQDGFKHPLPVVLYPCPASNANLNIVPVPPLFMFSTNLLYSANSSWLSFCLKIAIYIINMFISRMRLIYVQYTEF